MEIDCVLNTKVLKMFFVLVVCLLEGSGKWPEDKDAIRRLKAAFYIKLGDLLTEKKLQVRVRPDHVDVCRVSI